MSAVVNVQGTVRTVEPKTKRNSSEVWGRVVAVLTESGGILGETLEVALFNSRHGEPDVRAVVGDHVAWVVEVDASPYGLQARYRGEAGSEAALASTSPAVEGWLSGATAETVPSA